MTDIIDQALEALRTRLREPSATYATCPDDSRNLVRLHLAGEQDEVFMALFFTARNELIAAETLFRGTVDGTNVHPRAILRAALHHNAVAVVVAHNHPSGNPKPSEADKRLTERLREALTLIDVRLLDHLIVGSDQNMHVLSMAEQGLL